MSKFLKIEGQLYFSPFFQNNRQNLFQTGKKHKLSTPSVFLDIDYDFVYLLCRFLVNIQATSANIDAKHNIPKLYLIS